MSEAEQRKEETLADLMRALWTARVFVGVGVLIALLCAFVFMRMAVPHYEAHVILAPANPMNMAAVRDDESGEGIAEQTDAVFTRFEASFKGAAVAGLLLRDPEVTAGLELDRAFHFSKSEDSWTPEKLAEYIAQRVKIDPVGETRLRGYSYLHPDKGFAVAFLQRLHNVTDGLIRHGMRKDVNERIAYLNAAIAETMNPDHRRAMTDLLMEQERLKMLVSIDQPYAASVVVPAASSVKARWPDAALMYLGFGFVGAFLGFVVYGLRRIDRDQVLSVLEKTSVKQEPWFLPESGNSNEKPGDVDKAQRPLTGKKHKKKAPSKKKGKGRKSVPPEAAE